MPLSSSVEKGNAGNLRGLIEFCNRERLPGLDKLGESLKDDMTFENPITGRTDKAGMRNLHTGLWSAFPDFNYDIGRTFSKGDAAVLECVFSGTHKGDLMGIPPTNKHVAFPLAFMVDFGTDGKVKSWRSYFDTGTLMKQLGVTK